MELYRGKKIGGNEWFEGSLICSGEDRYIISNKENAIIKHSGDWYVGVPCFKVIPETVGQFTGIYDKNSIRIFKGDKFSFWVCYPTTQTHTGDNIPCGSYTEPDETQLLKLEAEVVWDESNAKWSFSLLSKRPYQFDQYFNFYWGYDDNKIPIIERTPYSLEYVKEYYGYEGISDEEWQEYLSDIGFSSEKEMMSEVNKIEVIGNIHDNPNLMS